MSSPLTVLARKPSSDDRCRDRNLSIRLVGYGVAIIKIRSGCFAGCYVKGVNDINGHRLSPELSYGDCRISTSEPCDVAILGDGYDFVSVASGSTGSCTVLLGGMPLPGLNLKTQQSL